MHELRIPSQALAVALGIGALLVASWSFEQAWEARDLERPRVAKWLPV